MKSITYKELKFLLNNSVPFVSGVSDFLYIVSRNANTKERE